MASQRVDIELLVLFPYFLYRFAIAFNPPGRRIQLAVTALTSGLTIWTFALRHVPAAGEHRSAWFLAYVLTFLVIGIMWVNHHQIMPTASLATRHLMWWNNNLLFWMSLVPFVTGFLGANPFRPLAYALYGSALALCILSLMSLRLYIAHRTKTARAVDAHHERLLRKTALGAALYAASVPLAYVSVYISMTIFAVVPAMFFLPEALPGKLPEELEK